MSDPIHRFQQAILNPSAHSGADDDDLLARLLDAANGVNGQRAVGTGDLGALIRQCLVLMSLKSDRTARLRVPVQPGWPALQEWQSFGCSAVMAGNSQAIVQQDDWNPGWLDADARDVVNAAISRSQRRSWHPVPIDPAVGQDAAYTSYSSAGQRAAVRAAFLMPPGSTLIVNLPTGAGKSLVFQAPTLAHRASRSLTVVIVPTVALARDQARRFSELYAVGMPLAYHSGLSGEEKEAVINSVRNGELPILFTSPEAVLGALRGPLFQAAEEHRLRYLVIDEAHLITQWGEQFRPEFQALPGLRDALRMACSSEAHSVRTLLLTATLTQNCYDTIRLLFGRDECELVGELALRTEPAFLISHAADEAERTAKVLEAVRFLPKPMIIYTTLREDAEKFLLLLRESNFHRIRMVRGGDMSNEGGDELLRAWQRGHIDIVVATSAFGLGVDHSGVRSVIHACLPETLDRYYQEVGRTGRDGRASVALLVTTPDDWEIAKSLAKKRLISVERGFERWTSMWVRRTMDSDGRFIVSLNERPADIEHAGPGNSAWNLRTLNLMQQAGLIRIVPHRPPRLKREENETEEDFNCRRNEVLGRFLAEVPIEPTDPRHSSRLHWDSAVAKTRTKRRRADRDSLKLLSELLNLQRPLNELFREIYTLLDPEAHPAYVSGSCPVTRKLRIDDFSVPPGDAMECGFAPAIDPALQQVMASHTDDARRCWVSMPVASADRAQQRRTREDLVRCLAVLVSRGVIEVSAPTDYLSSADWNRLRDSSPIRFVVSGGEQDPPFSPPPPLARASVLRQKSSGPTSAGDVMLLHRPLHIIFFPEDLPDPRHPRRALRDMVPHCSLEAFASRLTV